MYGTHAYIPLRGQQKFFKGQIVNILGLMGPIGSVTAIQLCHCSKNTSVDKQISCVETGLIWNKGHCLLSVSPVLFNQSVQRTLYFDFNNNSHLYFSD